MTDPHHPQPKTPRAEPLQPDKPGSGTGRDESADSSGHDEERSARELREQEKRALENVREGYGR